MVLRKECMVATEIGSTDRKVFKGTFASLNLALESLVPSCIHFSNLPLSGDASVIIRGSKKAGEHNLALMHRKMKNKEVFQLPLSIIVFSL